MEKEEKNKKDVEKHKKIVEFLDFRDKIVNFASLCSPTASLGKVVDSATNQRLSNGNGYGGVASVMITAMIMRISGV